MRLREFAAFALKKPLIRESGSGVFYLFCPGGINPKDPVADL